MNSATQKKSQLEISNADVKHMADLSAIPISNSEAEQLAEAFRETLATVANLKSVDTSDVDPTHQVTGLENITRPDVVNTTTMFTQQQALANAPRTHQGYFVVTQVLDKEKESL